MDAIKEVLILVSLMAGNAAIVETVKRLWSMLTAKVPYLSQLKLENNWSWALSAISAFAINYYFGVDFSKIFGVAVPATSAPLAEQISFLLSAATTLIGSNKIYDGVIKSAAG